MWQLGALLREASCILSEGFSRLLLAFADVPRVAESYVGSFEVALKHPDQIGPIVNLVGRELLKPSAGGVGEEEWQLSDDGSIVPSGASKLTGQPEICQPELWLGLAVVLCDAGRGSKWAGQRRAADCPAEHLRASWFRGHPVLVAVVSPAAVGAVTAFFLVPIPTATILVDIASRVVSSLVVNTEDECGLSPSKGRLLMDRHLLFILG